MNWSFIKASRRSTFNVPKNSVILWYGVEGDIPAEYEIYTEANDCFVMGAATGGMSVVVQGALTHIHTNPNTGAAGGHDHPLSASTSVTSTRTSAFAESGASVSTEGHEHTVTATMPEEDDHVHSVGDTGAGDSLPAYIRLYWIRAKVLATLPIGGILIWSKALTIVPDGLHACTGAAFDGMATPNIVAKMIYAAASDSDVGDTGAGDPHSHTNPTNTNAAGTHKHWITAAYTRSSSTKAVSDNSAGTVWTSSRNHDHADGVVESSTVADHVHSLNDTEAAAVVPPFVKVHFIMRTI